MKHVINKKLSTMLALVSTCTLANLVHADEAPKTELIGGSSMIVTKDKETGALRPATAKEMAKMKKSSDPSVKTDTTEHARSLEINDSGSKMIYHKSGMKSIVLDESHMQQLHATRNANGKLVLHHEKVKPKEQSTNGLEK